MKQESNPGFNAETRRYNVLLDEYLSACRAYIEVPLPETEAEVARLFKKISGLDRSQLQLSMLRAYRNR